jgi:hypothetical protein
MVFGQVLLQIPHHGPHVCFTDFQLHQDVFEHGSMDVFSNLEPNETTEGRAQPKY